MRMLIFLKADQLGLFDKLVQVRASVSKTGVVRKPHVATRHVKPGAPKHPDLFEHEAKPNPVDAALAEVKRQREAREARAQEPSAADLERAGLTQIEQEIRSGKPARASDAQFRAALGAIAEAVLSRGVDSDRLRKIAERARQRGPGFPEAVLAIVAPKPEAAAGAAKEPPGPKEGDTKVEDGVEYVLKDGRWHRATPEPDPEFEAAEDREDIAEALSQDPHSAESKERLAAHVAKHAPPPPPPPAVEDDLDPSSPNYRYRDTGYVAGSRKELAAEMIRTMARRRERVRVTDIDWGAIEENPREAKDLIVKETLFGAVDWTELRDAGMEPGAGFLLSRVYAAVGTKPAEDTPDSRRDYALAITTLRDRMEAVTTADEVIKLVEEMRDERDGVWLNEREAELFKEAQSQWREAITAEKVHDRHVDEQRKRIGALSGDQYTHAREVTQRQRRGWKVDPAKQALVDGMQREIDVIEAEIRAYRVEHGMDPIVHRETTPGGARSTFEYPYRERSKQLYEVVRAIKNAAVVRNRRENPMTRAWTSLGEGFNAILSYRGRGGSEAFAKHVAGVRLGKVTTWDWAEKKGEPKGATKRGTSFQLIVADDFRREGGPAVDVSSTEALKAKFNLREVQSGNWVLDDPNSAKFHVEACAQGFADLADILGVSPDLISFNGRLAMAFGARGKGSAKAHYEPVHRVINMTKMAGAGSLAHEWFHCVDNLVKEAVTGVSSGADDFATLAPASVDDPELSKAFRDVVNAMMAGPHRKREAISYTEAEERWAAQNIAMGYAGGIRAQIKNAGSMQEAADVVDAAYGRGAFGNPDKKRAKTQRDQWRKIALIHHGGNAARQVEYEVGAGMSMFLLDAMHLDKGESGKYWSAPHEMAARAFSGWVQDKLQAGGRENTYLVAGCNNSAYRGLGLPFRPFPEGPERERVNAAFERLFGLMRDRDVLAKAALLWDVVTAS